MNKEIKEFENAEEVWFWFCNSMKMKVNSWKNRNNEYSKYTRKCETADIERILHRLKMQCIISNRHIRVMLKWGSWDTPPYYDSRAKRSEIRLWEDGITALGKVLIEKGIL